MASSNGNGSFAGATADALIREGTAALKAAADNFSYRVGYRGDAEYLLAWAAGEMPALREPIAAGVRRRFERAIRRRVTGEPIPYITGMTEFDGMELTVKRGAFVPRVTSEALAKEAAKRLKPRTKPVHVDLATGIGPVALSVAKRVPHAKVHALDLSAKACELAELNAKKLGLKNVSVYRGNLLAPLPSRLKRKVDVITIHPPYIAADEIAELPSELRDFEPKMSLTDRSGDGLALLEKTAKGAPDWLRDDGWLIVEIGTYLVKDATALIADHGFRKIDSIAGPFRSDRVIRARR